MGRGFYNPETSQGITKSTPLPCRKWLMDTEKDKEQNTLVRTWLDGQIDFPCN